jgi:predicted dehydrogenase
VKHGPERRGTAERPLGVAVVGAGYWGPNLIRNFAAHVETTLLWVCDRDESRLSAASRALAGTRTTTTIEDVLDDDAVDIVAIATPAATHLELGLACLASGRHVLMEKPLATSTADARRLVAVAEENDVVLMCDHTYCYTPPVLRIRELLLDGTVGDVQYVDSVRINLGLVQPDIDVTWDLAPHDLSILDFVLPPDQRPIAVSASTADPLGVGQACIGFLTLPLPNGGIVHVHVNWLSPTKIRKTIVAGSKRMLVWDDLLPSQRLSMYDRGIDATELDPEGRKNLLVSYRTGDMVAPALPEREALGGVVDELVAAIREHRQPLTDGQSGLRVVAALEAASRSVAEAGRLVPLEP